MGLIRKTTKFVRLVGAVRNWPRTLMDHLHILMADYVCELRNGCRFRVRPGTDDRHVIFEIFVERLYPTEVSPGDIVVDVGAHIGCFSVLAAKCGARVFSFEPYPENYAILQHNVSLNGAENVRSFHTAVSTGSGTRKLFLPDNASLSGRFSLHPGRGTQTIDVPSTTLDAALLDNEIDHIDLLKLDCQGSEYEILFGMKEDTLARTRRIIVECEPLDEAANCSREGVESYLEQRGFSVRTNGDLVFAERVSA